MSRPNQFLSPEGDIEDYFVDEYWLIDQYVGDELWAWGNGYNGRLGNVSTANVSTPVTTSAGGTNWKQVSCSRNNAASIKTDGTLWTWGPGNFGQLGNAISTARSTPVTTFSGGSNWKQVSVGYRHTAAIKTDGTLWTWGSESNGRLGNKLILSIGANRYTPITTFAGGTDWADTSTTAPENLYTLSCSRAGVGAIKTDGTLWVWGRTDQVAATNNINVTINVSTPVTTFSGGTNWKQISCGYQQAAAIKTDGTLWTWGQNLSGELGINSTTNGNQRCTPVTTFAGGTNWKNVSVGRQMMAATKTDGTLWVWGNAASGKLGNATTLSIAFRTPVTTFAGGTNWNQVSCGYNHTAATKTDGTLWVWGNNAIGLLGDGKADSIANPSCTVPNSSNVVTVASTTGLVVGMTVINSSPFRSQFQNAVITNITSGTTFTISITNTTGAYSGFIMFRNTVRTSTPVTTFAGGTNWKQVSCGYQNTGAVKTDGTLWVWGNNGDPNLGLGINSTTNTVIITPVTTFAGGTNWKQVNMGRESTTAVKTDGTLWVWGLGSLGRTGTNQDPGSIKIDYTPVTTFAGGTNWKQTSSSRYYFVALNGNQLFTCGYGTFLGSLIYDNSYIPDQVSSGGVDWKQVSAGGMHTAAIKTDGTLWVWGYNYPPANILTPVTISAGGNTWKQVSCGYRYITSIKTDGTLWVWGQNTFGQLGTNDITNRNTPVTTFSGGTNWKQVSTGGYHIAAIKTDGTLWTWGRNNGGQLGTNDLTNRSTPVTTFAGGTDWKQLCVLGKDFINSMAAIKTDGTLWVWGDNSYGKLGDTTVILKCTPVTTFAGGTNWKQVANSQLNTFAVFSGTTPDLPIS